MRGRFSGVSAVLFSAALTLVGQAYASTISSYSISTTAQGGTPCSMSGSGPATASCSSTNGENFHSITSVVLTDTSITLNLSSHMASSAVGFASITHDDFFSVPVNGPVSVVMSLTCDNIGTSPPLTGHFSLGSTNVSPPVETVWMGASQGSGPCGIQYRLRPPAGFDGTFVAALSATNNIVHLHTYIDAGGSEPDSSGLISVQLTVIGFQDANGNPITATLVPEPNTWLTLGLGLLIAALRKQLTR